MESYLVLLLLTVGAFASPINWKITGGSIAKDGQFPYQISLRENDGHICGGSIINPNTILTAAHCVEEELFNIYTVVTGTNKVSGAGDLYTLKSITKHSNFNYDHRQDDIALLHLSSNIQYNDKVQPIPLSTSFVGPNSNCVLSGWGQNSSYGVILEDLKYVNLLTIDNKDCVQKHHYTKFPITDNHICTFTRFGEGMCMGDSGGPIVSNGEQIGIVSWGKPCGIGYPDVYTRVSAYQDWIKKNLNN